MSAKVINENCWNLLNEDYELKAAIAPKFYSAIANSLASKFERPGFSQGFVHSLYLTESPRFQEVIDKIDSNFYKKKIRIRAYSDSENGPLSAVFFEIKYKNGYLRTKKRCDFSVYFPKAAQLLKNGATLKDFFLDFTVLNGFIPMVYITYERKRFLDVLNQCHLNLDQRLKLVQANPLYFGFKPEIELSFSLLELKSQHLNQCYTSLRQFPQLKQSSFSKLVYFSQIIKHNIDWTKNEPTYELLTSDYA